jgi:3-oxoacyl-[acyl-carrier-protein] synthase I
MSHFTVVVAGVGARTAVGMNAPASAAAVRAGIVRFGEDPFLFEPEGDPFLVARPSYLEIDLQGGARLAALAGPAAGEALAPLARIAGQGLSIPLYLGLPPARPGRPTDLVTAVVGGIRDEMLRLGIRPAKVRTIETGHSAGAMAIGEAWEAVRTGALDLALAGGVDSYLEKETMAWLLASGQLHGAEGNPWGFVPGEAAAFALLSSDRVADRLAEKAAIEVLIAATSRETKLIKTDAVCLGEGLTSLFRALRAGLPPGQQADDLLCDMNGEPYRADEFGFAALRAGQIFRDASAFVTPAASWGDVGAASGPLFLALADAASRRRYSSGPLTAAFTSSESGERSGFLVRNRGDERQQKSGG